MKSRWVRIALATLLLCAWARSGQAQYRDRYPLPNGTVPDVLGVNIHFNDPRPGEMEQLAAAGFRWIRQDFAWAGIEREKGHYDFAPYDRLMGHLKKFGIRPIFILDYGNDLYQQGSPNTPEARAAFGRFASAAVTHFKGQGIVWEMWNEPNIGFWKPKPNWDEYVALALETGKAIRRTAPDEWFVGPGMSGMDFPFLRRCVGAGLLNYWDAVSFHPYRDTAPETAAADFAQVRSLLDQYAPRGKKIPMLSSEWGYSELYPGLNRERQSWYIARQTLTNLIHGLRISIWYDWHDDGTDAKEAEHHFGTVYNDYREKETYKAVQTLSKTLNGFTYNKRLALDSPDDYCLLFDRYNPAGDDICLVAWTVGRTSHSVVLPASAGNFRVISYLGGPSKQTATADGLHVTLTEAPIYLTPAKSDLLLERAAAWEQLPPYLRFGDAASIVTLTELSGDVGFPFPASVKLQQAVGVDPKSTEFRTVLTMPITRSKTVRIPPEMATLVDRSATVHRFRAVLSAKGMKPLVQETELVSRDPIGITPLSPFGALLPVQITNVSGKALHGWLRARVDNVENKVAVDFVNGETSKRVEVRLARPLTADSALHLDLLDRAKPNSAPVVAVPAVRFQNLLTVDQTPLEQVAKVYSDGDPKIASQIELTSAPTPAGLAAAGPHVAKLAYDFAAGWKFLRVAPVGKLLEPLPGVPDALGIWVYSDGSNNVLRARFVDATGQTFQPDGGRLNGKGWQYVTIPLHPGGGHWGGANDDKVHYPIRLDTLLLIDTPDQKSTKGEIYFTNVALTYPAER